MNARSLAVGFWIPLLLVTAFFSGCSSDSTGLDSKQLESRWKSTSPSSWVEISTSSTTGVERATHDDVIEAFQDLIAYRVRCGREPSSCDVSRLAVEGSGIDARLRELMAGRIANGITASDRGRATYRIEAVEFDSVDRAAVTTCLVDDTVLVIDSAIFDDSVYSARSIWTLERMEGDWRWSDERIIEWIMEGSLCDEL